MDERREGLALEAVYQLSGVVDTLMHMADDENGFYTRRSLVVRAEQLTSELIWLLSDSHPGVPDTAEGVIYGYRLNPPESDAGGEADED